MATNNEEKILTLKSLEKSTRLNLNEIDNRLEKIEKKLKIIENSLRR